jgi:hypothetical protein
MRLQLPTQLLQKRISNLRGIGRKPAKAYQEQAFTEEHRTLNTNIRQLANETKHDTRVVLYSLFLLTAFFGAGYIITATHKTGIDALVYTTLGLASLTTAAFLFHTEYLNRARDERQERKQILKLETRLQIYHEKLAELEASHGRAAMQSDEYSKQKTALCQKMQELTTEVELATEVDRRVGILIHDPVEAFFKNRMKRR